MKDYIEERVLCIADYIIENGTTVREAAGRFGISKSTVHTVETIQNGLLLFTGLPVNQWYLDNNFNLISVGSNKKLYITLDI